MLACWNQVGYKIRMEWTVNVAVDRSAFPDRTRARILEGLRRKRVDAALLYSGWRQTEKWIALHRAVSPASGAGEVKELYSSAFNAIAAASAANVLHVIGLGCGDGAKDTDCVARIRDTGKAAIYSPCDISMEMVLTAQSNASSAIRGLQCTPLLFDLLECSTLPGIFKSFDPSGAERVVLFLGSLHNFDPVQALKAILYGVRATDTLVLSANLAPEAGYREALARILPQYDNPATREWLMGGLSELGLSNSDGQLNLALEESPASGDLKEIVAHFCFERQTAVRFGQEHFRFAAGEKLRLFSSTRFTKGWMRAFCQKAGLQVAGEFIAASEEEGVFVCRRTSR